MKIINYIISFIFRLIALPFMACLFIFYYIRLLFKNLANFLIYGGETITYSKDRNRATIFDVYTKVSNNINT